MNILIYSKYPYIFLISQSNFRVFSCRQAAFFRLYFSLFVYCVHTDSLAVLLCVAVLSNAFCGRKKIERYFNEIKILQSEFHNVATISME